MKKVLNTFIAGLTFIYAVQWDFEQITFDGERASNNPLLCVDAANNPWVFYSNWGDDAFFKIAENDTDGWYLHDVAEIGYRDNLLYYSIDGLGKGNMYAAYADTIGGVDAYELFLATQDGSDFIVNQLTEDFDVQQVPVVRLDNLGNPHLIYIQEIGEDFQLSHGWLNDDELLSEQITTNLYLEEYTGHDLVFDANNVPHVIYVGDDGYLWHTTSGEPDWTAENLNQISSEFPSAIVDNAGYIHVSYDVEGSSIRYITNKTGTWEDELVSDYQSQDGGNERSCIGIDSDNNPHITWVHANPDWWYDIYYVNKLSGSWIGDPVTSTPDKDESPGYGRFFEVDSEGYGHLAFETDDEMYVTQIYYARSAQPLTVGIEEKPVIDAPVTIETQGEKILLTLPDHGWIDLNLYDASGRSIDHLFSGSYPAGKHSIDIGLSNLSSGVYFVHAKTSQGSASTKLVVTR